MQKFLLILLASTMLVNLAKAESRTERREANPFTQLSLRVAANLYIEQGDEHSIEVTANERTLDKLIVEVEQGKMIIRFSLEDRLFADFKAGPIEIHVVTKDIHKLSIQGSGNIYAENLIDTYNLELNISGAGDIKLSKVKAEKIEALIAGSGDIVLSGNSKGRELDIDIAGSGDVVAYQYEAESAYVRIAGSGDCEINVTDFLDVKIVGSGDVLYKGDPSIKSQITGSGKINSRQ